jgi:hypothetical protein
MQEVYVVCTRFYKSPKKSFLKKFILLTGGWMIFSTIGGVVSPTNPPRPIGSMVGKAIILVAGAIAIVPRFVYTNDVDLLTLVCEAKRSYATALPPVPVVLTSADPSRLVAIVDPDVMIVYVSLGRLVISSETTMVLDVGVQTAVYLVGVSDVLVVLPDAMYVYALVAVVSLDGMAI